MDVGLLTAALTSLAAFVASLFVVFGLPDQAIQVKAVAAAAGPFVVAVFAIMAHRTAQARVNAAAQTASAKINAAATTAAASAPPDALAALSSPQGQQLVTGMLSSLMGNGASAPPASQPSAVSPAPVPTSPAVQP